MKYGYARVSTTDQDLTIQVEALTNASKKITSVGGSLRDIQYLAGHSSLQTTQGYIEGESRAREKVVELV